MKHGSSIQRTTARRTRRSSPDDTLIVGGETQAQQPSAPEIVQLQKVMGNRAVQRAISGAPVPLAKQISRAPSGDAQRMLQRNIFHSMFKGFARKNIFGKNKDRRKIEQDTATVKRTQNAFFDDVKDVTVKNGPHNLTGRHYKGLTDPRKGDLKYAGKTVLFLSGSGGSAETYGLPLAQFYCMRGADFVAVNYRGFGGSTKDTKTITGKATTTQIDNSDITEDGLYSDARAIFQWLTGEGVSPENILIQGFSLGGPVAAELTAYLAGRGIRVGGLVLESPMDSVKEQAKQAAPNRGIGSFIANSGEVVMDLRQHLRTLVGIEGFKDLAIYFMSGQGSAGDQLALSTTNVNTDAEKMGFTNVRSSEARGEDHEAVKAHAKIAEKGANTYDNAANSLDNLFKKAEVQLEVVPEAPKPLDPVAEVVVQKLEVLVKDAE
ncbi:MAG: alpha/beta fold hydrolase [Anaerolineae bacterium]|jgi:pimeloyl-ACP methyl ester carboxylesterase|nr:alpha/beta fold hydrolase [Anaerolineae bacterium]